MHQHGLDPTRVARVGADLAVDADAPTQSLCLSAARVVGVSGAGVMLVSGGHSLATLCVSDPIAEAIEEAQYTLGQGPCVDAYEARAPVLVPDLASAHDVRWAEFRDRARAVGVRAMFGYPLLVETVCLGALNLYQKRPGALSADQHGDALAVAHVATRMLLGWQSGAGPNSLAWQLEQVPVHLAAIHQAAGMVSVQMGTSTDDALALLRAHAFAEDKPINDVACEVVSRRLRFGDPPSSSHDS